VPQAQSVLAYVFDHGRLSTRCDGPLSTVRARTTPPGGAVVTSAWEATGRDAQQLRPHVDVLALDFALSRLEALEPTNHLRR